jgi:hypothetical protein
MLDLSMDIRKTSVLPIGDILAIGGDRVGSAIDLVAVVNSV